MKKNLEALNPSQLKAVKYCDGPSLIVAGAGSGKTRVLINKIIYLIEEMQLVEWEIMALTFTNKAARELKERIAKFVEPRLIHKQWVGTFHGVFLNILHREHRYIGFSNYFTVYDTSDSRSLLTSIIKEMGLDTKIYKPVSVLNSISKCKSQLVTADQYNSNPENLKSDAKRNWEAFGKIFQQYCYRCHQSDAMDFDDILLYTYLLFEKCPEVLAKWRDKIKYVLVDEFQDTNYAQAQILWQLVGEKQIQHICVVGDDAQSIYSFRGANIDNILNFQSLYDNVRLFKLEQNYRSTQNIVEAANSLIEKNSRQIRKKVFSENDRGDKLHLLEAHSDIEEAKLVVNAIRGIKRKEGCEYSDFAVLYRTNAQSRMFEDTMRKDSMPYRIYGGQSFYQRKEIKDVIAYFRLAVNPNDEEAFKRVINYPARGIGQTTVSKILQTATTHEVSLWTVIGTPEQYELGVNKGTLTKIGQFRELIESFIEQARTLPANQVGAAIVKQSGIIADIYQDTTPENLSRQENVEELMNGMSDFCDMRMEEGNENISLSDYLSEVSLMSDVDSDKGDDGHKITLMTIHSAKGLEFNTVFVVGLEEGLFPSDMVSGNPREMEEERRLFYVAITRAKTHCYLSYAQCRFRYGQMEFSSPSRFLKDIDSKYLDKQQSMFSFRKSMEDEVSLPWQRKGGLFGGGERQESSRPFRPTILSAKPVPSARPTSTRPASTMPLSARPVSSVSQASASLPRGDEGLKEGNIILHNRFGRGEVLRVEGTGDNTKATVQFENVGTKQLLLKFAKFEVID